MTDKPLYEREPGVTYDLATEEGFNAFAKRFGYLAAKAARFSLAYSGPYRGPSPEPMQYAGACTGRYSSRDPKPAPLPQRYSTLNQYIKQQAHAERVMHRLFATDYSEIERRAMRWVKAEYPNVNLNPRYSPLCSITTLLAVYKANSVTDIIDSRWDDYTDSYDWLSLSKATDSGIVFG